MRIHRLLLIIGIMLIPALLAGCGQQRSTGGGTHATQTFGGPMTTIYSAGFEVVS